MRRTAIWILLTAGLLSAQVAWAQEAESLPCEGLLAESDQLGPVLGEVSKYASTYVLVYPDRLAEKLDSLDSPALRQLRLAVYAGSPAEAIAARLDPREVVRYPFDVGEAGKIVEDVLAGEVDAAVLWGPLAGLAVLELDYDYRLSLRTASVPAPAPAALSSSALAAPSRAGCGVEISGQLEGYGVVPAEKLVRLDIRDFLELHPPARDLAEARAGAPLYAEHCAKCHGPDAVAAPGSLAPVDLLISVPRFSYPGFLYIVLNGRSQNGMPGFNGSLEREQVERIYQFVRARSHGEIAAAGGSAR